MTSKLKQYSSKPKQFLIVGVSVLILTYLSTCLLLLLRQRHLIYRPAAELSQQPDAPDFNLPYEDVWIPIPNSQAQLHGWWIPAPAQQKNFVVIPDEPKNVLTSPKVMLYLCGVGRNMGDYNWRIFGGSNRVRFSAKTTRSRWVSSPKLVYVNDRGNACDSNKFTPLCQFTRLALAKATEQLVNAMVTPWFGFGSVLTQNTTNFYHKSSCWHKPGQERTD